MVTPRAGRERPATAPPRENAKPEAREGVRRQSPGGPAQSPGGTSAEWRPRSSTEVTPKRQMFDDL